MYFEYAVYTPVCYVQNLNVRTSCPILLRVLMMRRFRCVIYLSATRPGIIIVNIDFALLCFHHHLPRTQASQHVLWCLLFLVGACGPAVVPEKPATTKFDPEAFQINEAPTSLSHPPFRVSLPLPFQLRDNSAHGRSSGFALLYSNSSLAGRRFIID